MPPGKRERPKGRNGKRSVGWYITWSVITAVVIAVLAGFLFSLPIWRIDKVRVTGNNYLPEAKIINIAMIPQGENIFMIDLEEVTKRFSNIIQIKSIMVKRKLPGTIVFEVTERSPYAIAVIDGAAALVDDDGYIISRQGLETSGYRMDIAKYPVIRGITKKSLERGIRLGSGDRAFVKSALSSLSRFMDISSIQIETGNKEDIIIYIEDMLKVKIGDPADIERKIMVVKALLGSIKGKWPKVAYIDVRVPDDPVIKFK